MPGKQKSTTTNATSTASAASPSATASVASSHDLKNDNGYKLINRVGCLTVHMECINGQENISYRTPDAQMEQTYLVKLFLLTMCDPVLAQTLLATFSNAQNELLKLALHDQSFLSLARSEYSKLYTSLCYLLVRTYLQYLISIQLPESLPTQQHLLQTMFTLNTAILELIQRPIVAQHYLHQREVQRLPAPIQPQQPVAGLANAASASSMQNALHSEQESPPKPKH